jgi:hypothetical protein
MMTEVPESLEVLKERETRAAFDRIDQKFGPRYYDMDGKPMSMWDWTMRYELQVNRHVGNTRLRIHGHEYWVSTVHLGLDHSFSPRPHKPVIFETMVFKDGDMGGLDYMRRYCTKEEAARGHRQAVREVRRFLSKLPKAKPLIHKGGKP